MPAHPLRRTPCCFAPHQLLHACSWLSGHALDFGCLLLSHQHEGTIVGDGIRSPPGWQVHAPSLPTGPQAGPGSHWPPISALAAQCSPLFTQTPTATPRQHLRDLLVDHGLLASLGRLFLHCCPARRWWEHRFRTHSWSCKPHLHHLPQALLLLGRSQPLSVLTLSPGGPSGPGEPSSPISPVGPGSPLLPGAPCKSKQDQTNQWVLEQSPMCQRGQGQAQLWGQKWNGDFTPTFSPGLPGIPCRPGFPSSPGSPCTRTQQDRVNKDTSVPAGGFWFRAEEA